MQLLSADLRHITLGSLLQVAESDRLDGSFRFDPEGSLVLHKGGVTDAVHGRLKGIDAALTLLMVRSRSAVFEMFDTDDRPPIADTMALIIDGARLNDDWANLAPQVLGIRDGLDRSRLSRELASVVDHLDGTAIVNEAVKQAGSQGLLITLPKRGIQVMEAQPETIRECLDFRMVMDQEGARRRVASGNCAGLGTLRAQHQKLFFFFKQKTAYDIFT